MKMKKLLALVLALMLVQAMIPTSLAANAADSVEAYLSKSYNAVKGHAFDFVFSATQDTQTEGYNHTPVMLTIGVDNKISFSESDTGSTTKVAKLNFADFTQAGVYRYTVTETGVDPAFSPTQHEALILSKAKYEVLVYVQQVDGSDLDIGVDDDWDDSHDMELDSLRASNNPADYKIVSIIVTRLNSNDGTEIPGGEKVEDTTSNPDTNDFNFENTYVYEAGTGPDPDNPDPDYSTNGSLFIDKTVMKNGSEDSTDETAFSFTVTFTFPEGTDQDSLGGVQANDIPIGLDSGTTHTFILKHGQTLKLTHLPVGAQFIVVETGTPNYLASAKTTIDTSLPEENAEIYGDDLTLTEKELSVNTNTVEVTNTNLYVPPTGVIINALPFVLMFVIGSGALCLYIIFKRRKHAQEHEGA